MPMHRVGTNDNNEEVSKVSMWRYVIPAKDGLEGWGIVHIDSSGFFSGITDYGNFSYLFHPASNTDFRTFLLDTRYRPHFYLRTFSSRTEFDSARTVKDVMDYILETRRAGRMTKEEARREWGMAKELQAGESESDWYQCTNIDDAGEFLQYDYSSRAKTFVSEFLPRLVNMIRRELEREVSGQ